MLLATLQVSVMHTSLQTSSACASCRVLPVCCSLRAQLSLQLCTSSRSRAGQCHRYESSRARTCCSSSRHPAAASSSSHSIASGVTCSASVYSQSSTSTVNAAAQAPAVEVPTASTNVATAAAAAQVVLPYAALSRVLLTGNNSAVFRTALGQRRQPVSGPLGLLLFLATLIAASFAAIRSALVKRGKSCRTCRGFGLQRCRLCLGSGRVDWAAKLKHFDVCPLCMNKRFIICAECGGHYHRAMFSHRRRQAGGSLEPSGSDGFEGPIVLNLAAVGASAASGTAMAGSNYIVTRSMDGGAGGVSQILSSMND